MDRPTESEQDQVFRLFLGRAAELYRNLAPEHQDYEVRRHLFKYVSDDGRDISGLFPGMDPELVATPVTSNSDLTAWEFKASSHNHSGGPCGWRFKEGEPMYRCLTCGIDDSCVICKHCYLDEEHEGHQVSVTLVEEHGGGVCDCGDPEAWVNKFACKCCDSNDDNCHYGQDSNVNPALDRVLLQLTRMVPILLDFMIDVLGPIRLRPDLIDDQEDAISYDIDSLLPNEIYGADETDSNFYVVMWNDERNTFTHATDTIESTCDVSREEAMELARTVDQAGRAVVYEDDDLDTLLDLQDAVNRAGLFCTLRSQRAFMRERMVDTMCDWLIALTKMPNIHYATRARAIIGEALLATTQCKEPLFDLLMLAEQNSPENGFLRYRETRRPDDQRDSDARLKVSPHWTGQGFSYCDSKPPIGDVPGPRVQYLISYDFKVWKRLRLLLRDLYIYTLVCDGDRRLRLGDTYAMLYRCLVVASSLFDRETEHSILTTLSSEIFLTPSVATRLVGNGFITDLLAYNFTNFTQGFPLPAREALSAGPFHVRDFVLNRRDYSTLLTDTDNVLSKNPDKSLAACEHTTNQLVDLLTAFQGISPLSRMITSHVEYEPTDWTKFFNVVPYIYGISDQIAQGLDPDDQESIDSVLKNVITSIIIMVSGAGETYYDTENGQSMELKKLVLPFATGDRSYEIVSRPLNSTPISVHHPLHVFMSQVLQHTNYKNAVSRWLGRLLSVFGSIRSTEQAGLLVFENPFRTLSFLTQVQAGLWVRNGYSVQAQVHFYRESLLRESSYRADIIMCQLALSTMRPSTVMASMLDKWFLVDDKQSETAATAVDLDSSQKITLMEELLHYLIGFVTQRTYILGHPKAQADSEYLTKGIIQSLALKDASYSDIKDGFPSSIAEMRMFDDVLGQVAVYKPPSGVRDHGIYQLKAQYYREVDSHYMYYSSTDIEEVASRLATRLGGEAASLAMDPRFPAFGDGNPFRFLFLFGRSVPFAFLARKVVDIVSADESERGGTDAVFSFFMQLLHVLAVEESRIQPGVVSGSRSTDPDLFASLAALLCCRTLFEPDKSLLQMLWQLIDGHFENYRPKFQRIIKLLGEHSSGDEELLQLQHQPPNRASTSETEEATAESESDRRKRQAQERRARVLAEFNAKQQEFLKRNADFEESDEEDGDNEMNDLDQKPRATWTFPQQDCIICRIPGDSDSVFGMMGYSSYTNVLRRVPFDDNEWVREAFGSRADLDAGSVDFPDTNHCSGFPTSHTDLKRVLTSCGHGIHAHCFKDHVMSSTRGTLHRSSMTDTREFPCPLCKSQVNTFLPVLWQSNSRQFADVFKPEVCDLALQHILDSRSNYGAANAARSAAALTLFNMRPRYLESINAPPYASTRDYLAIHVLEGFRYFLASLDDSEIGMAPTNQLINVVTTLANSISLVEVSLREVDSNSAAVFVHQIPSQHLSTLRVLTESALTMVGVSVQDGHNLFGERGCVAYNSLARLDGKDAFEGLVKELVTGVPLAGFSASLVLRLAYVKAIVQSLVVVASQMSFGHGWTKDNSLEQLPGFEAVDFDAGHQTALARACKALGLPQYGTGSKVIYTMTRKAVLPFLRRAALLVRALCVSDAPSFEASASTFDRSLPEHDRLCQYLGLPSFDVTLRDMGLDGTIEQRAIARWATDLSSATGAPALDMTMEYPGPVRLLRLPKRLGEFYTNYASPEKSRVTIGDLAVCLFCGAQVVRLSFADEVDCQTHVKVCARVHGIFLLPKQNQILLIRAMQPSLCEGPYLDAHGESESQRPKTLQLNRYEHFTRDCWLTNGLPNYFSRNTNTQFIPEEQLWDAV